MKVLIICNFFILIGCQQVANNNKIDFKYIENFVNQSLNDKNSHNVINQKETIIKDDKSVIHIAETVLFNIYGEKNILAEKPYLVHHYKNFWYMKGSLNKYDEGGVFELLMDDRNAQIIRITHGK